MHLLNGFFDIGMTEIVADVGLTLESLFAQHLYGQRRSASRSSRSWWVQSPRIARSIPFHGHPKVSMMSLTSRVLGYLGSFQYGFSHIFAKFGFGVVDISMQVNKIPTFRVGVVFVAGEVLRES